MASKIIDEARDVMRRRKPPTVLTQAEVQQVLPDAVR